MPSSVILSYIYVACSTKMDLFNLALFIAIDDADITDIRHIRNIIHFIIDELNEPLQNDLLRNDRGIRTKNENYYEIIVPRYTDYLFKEHFRMSRMTFEVYKYYITLLYIC